ncbi:MAG: RICIN domain-containing protein [Lachnospiraceae bacterium]|nr:RICIN domain-containing protein [Lachnospiraceae bacterium]
MLDIEYGKNEDGTNIQTYSNNGADAQKFKIQALGNNQYAILTKVSSDKKALDVYNFGTSDGANVCQWTYYKNNNQIWYFEACSN